MAIKTVDVLPEMTIGMFSINGKARETQASFDARVRHFFGPVGEQFIEGVQQGRLDEDSRRDYKGLIDPYFFAAFADAFKVPDGLTPRGFYSQAGEIAMSVVAHLARLTKIDDFKDPFLDEMNPHAPSPTDLLFHLARLNQGRNPKLDFSTKKHFLLLNIAASFEATSESDPIKDVLSDMQFEMNKSLYYRGRDGFREQCVVYAYHDPLTNRFLGFTGDKPEVDLNKRLLRHEYDAHVIEKVGRVYTIRNSKDPVSATEKAIAEAFDHNGVIRPQDVKDNMRMTFVALEGNLSSSEVQRRKQVGIVHKRVLAFLQGYKGIRKIVPHDRVDNSRGQSRISWKRDDVYLHDTCVPLEFVTIREPDYLNYRLEIGHVDPETGLYKGSAHRLYDIRRNAPGAILLLQEVLSPEQAMRALAVKSIETAEDIRRIGEVRAPGYNPRDLVRIAIGGR